MGRTQAATRKGKAVAAAQATPAVPAAAAPHPNLTDLADRFGSDKGSAKHRYSELYQMLFLPYRTRAIRFLEMGLQIGGPEHGAKADRETTDLPSVRMWLDYFPKARIHGLDVSDFAWFRHPRFSFHRCDMDDPAALAATAAALPDLDIIIDDASHASHHQQNAFLALFPKLAPGGLYVIEDLRWQPAAYEREGITKTADLFRGFSEGRTFRHSHPATEAAFAALAAQISGCFMFQVRYARTRRDQVAVIHKR
jgi:hypothetical protein